LRVHPRATIEVLDLACRLVLVGRRVEVRDLAEARDPVDEVRPRGVDVVADRADDAEAGDDDAAVGIGLWPAAGNPSEPWRGGGGGGRGGPGRSGGAGRAGAAGARSGGAGGAGAMRLIRPGRPRPGPPSMNRSMPAATIDSTARTQSTPVVRCSTSSVRASA